MPTKPGPVPRITKESASVMQKPSTRFLGVFRHVSVVDRTSAVVGAVTYPILHYLSSPIHVNAYRPGDHSFLRALPCKRLSPSPSSKGTLVPADLLLVDSIEAAARSPERSLSSA